MMIPLQHQQAQKRRLEQLLHRLVTQYQILMENWDATPCRKTIVIEIVAELASFDLTLSGGQNNTYH
jgi:hypothetical protein